MACKHLIISFALLFSASVQALTISDEKSPNGVAYTLISMPDAEQISVQLAWKNDWIYQKNKNQAVPYIGTQLILAGGAENYSPGEVVETFADLESHGFLNAAIGHVYGVLNFKKEHLEETITIANAHLHKPTLNEAWFKRIRQQVKNNVGELNAQQVYKSFNTLRWAIMEDSPLRESISLDASAQFDSLNREDVVQWHQQTLTNTPEAIIIAGNIDSDQASKTIDALLAGLPTPATNKITQSKPLNFTPKRILLHLPEASTSQLFFTGRIPPIHQGKEFEDLIITQALGGSEQSELFKAVRTQLRASYGYGAATTNFTREDRIFFMEGEIETNKIAQAEKLITETYRNFLTQGPKGSIDDYKAANEHPFEHIYQNVSMLASSAMQSKLDGFNNQRILTLFDELQAVSAKTIKDRLASAYPKADELIVLVSSPDKNALADACVITTPQQAKDC